MNDTQFYILFAVPLVGILCNTALFVHVSGRVDRLAERMDARIDLANAHIEALNTKFDTRFDLLMGKVVDIDNRLIRVETKLGIGQ